MTMRTLVVMGLLAMGAWLGASCAAGGGSSDCGDGDCLGSETSDNCPEDCGPYCGDDTCDPGEDTVSCNTDCFCGNGTCDLGETELTCTLDCLCGDGVCAGSETVANCGEDCYCGNGTCDDGESNTTCSTDCTTFCGDGQCNGDETATSCPNDCGSSFCGDNNCDPGEDATSCPADCSTSCIDAVCDLYPQCGCNTGQKCSLSGSDRACLAAGSTAAGGLCTADTDCAAGTLCLGRNQDNSERQCMAYCDPDNQNGCTGLTSYCNGLVDGNQITIPGAGVCSVTCQPHNPSSGCPAGWSCEVYTTTVTQVSFTDCHADIGPGVYLDACDNTAGPFCASGYGCFNDGTPYHCYQWCTATSSCDGGLGCDVDAFTPQIIVGGVTYGVCRL